MSWCVLFLPCPMGNHWGNRRGRGRTCRRRRCAGTPSETEVPQGAGSPPGLLFQGSPTEIERSLTAPSRAAESTRLHPTSPTFAHFLVEITLWEELCPWGNEDNCLGSSAGLAPPSHRSLVPSPWLSPSTRCLSPAGASPDPQGKPLSRLIHLHPSKEESNREPWELHPISEPYLCPDCGMSFTIPSAFLLCQKSHVGPSPHVCSDCGKAFWETMTLCRHQRNHTGGKPYHCSYWEKSFRTTTLCRHQRIHTGEKPYHCSYCEKSFRASSTLIIHQRNHTAEMGGLWVSIPTTSQLLHVPSILELEFRCCLCLQLRA
uniref:C2H2-type domain-containing protein n=1 Tax=Anser cygnoides TaxID=8845 RepID=A0A8B9IN24_ANSCY